MSNYFDELYMNLTDDPNVNMLVEMNWDYFMELEEE